MLERRSGVGQEEVLGLEGRARRIHGLPPGAQRQKDGPCHQGRARPHGQSGLGKKRSNDCGVAAAQAPQEVWASGDVSTQRHSDLCEAHPVGLGGHVHVDGDAAAGKPAGEGHRDGDPARGLALRGARSHAAGGGARGQAKQRGSWWPEDRAAAVLCVEAGIFLNHFIIDWTTASILIAMVPLWPRTQEARRMVEQRCVGEGA